MAKTRTCPLLSGIVFSDFRLYNNAFEHWFPWWLGKRVIGEAFFSLLFFFSTFPPQKQKFYLIIFFISRQPIIILWEWLQQATLRTQRFIGSASWRVISYHVTVQCELGKLSMVPFLWLMTQVSRIFHLPRYWISKRMETREQESGSA